jgi:hypothetical protein
VEILTAEEDLRYVVLVGYLEYGLDLSGSKQNTLRGLVKQVMKFMCPLQICSTKKGISLTLYGSVY